MAPPPCGLLVMLLVVPSLQRCVHDDAQARVRTVRAAAAGPARARSARAADAAAPQPIRIQTWLSGRSDGLPGADGGRLGEAVREAVGVVGSLLSVSRAQSPLRLSRDVGKYCKFIWKDSAALNHNKCGRARSSYGAETCLDVTIPDDHLDGCEVYPEPDSPRRTVLRPQGAGLPHADFLLYVLVRATDRCRAEPDVLAYAVHCRTDARGRPVAGAMVVCGDRLTGAAYRHQAAVQTVVHELLHVLGFSRELFGAWRDCPASSPCSSLGKVTRADPSGQVRLYTPSVVSALQGHLGSSDPGLGGPLENQGVPPGRASSHWESRVLQGSVMAAALGEPATVRIDAVTLAALRDTGWYDVDVRRAQSLVWGRGEGAAFGSPSTCNASSFFCTGSGLGCHFLHLHKGECQTDAFLEGCRVYKPLNNGSECFKEENNRRDRGTGEIFGSDSRCFVSNLTSQAVRPSGSVEGRCYRHRCTAPNRYQVRVSGSGWLDCPAGGSIQVNGYQGAVFCPDRRLCLSPDVTSAPADTGPSSAPDDPRPPPPSPWLHSSRGSSDSSAHGSSSWFPLTPAVTSALCCCCCCAAAAVCLLAALMASDKGRSCRVNAVAPTHHFNLE